MSIFHFKHFSIKQSNSAMKVGTDAMLLGAFINVEGKNKGLDIGAGTGVLSLMTAQRNKTIEIDAVEIDVISFQECQLNFKNSSWNSRLNVYSEDFRFFSASKEYDLIFSNPPYHSATNLNKDARKAQARHEKSLPSENILEKVNQLMSDFGDFWVIIPCSEKEKWVKNARLNELFIKKTITINGKPNLPANRVILCFSRLKTVSDDSFFTVRTENGNYSDEYIVLTKDFHAVDLRKKN